MPDPNEDYGRLKERLDNLVVEKNQYKEQLANATTRLADLEKEAKLATKHAEKVTELQKQLDAQAAQFETRIAMSDRGITDPDVRDAFEWQYGKMPADKRPKFSEYLDGLYGKPDEAPAVLRPFLAQPKKAAAGAEQHAPQRQSPPDANRGAKSVVGAPAPFSAEQIRAMSPSEFMASRAAIAAAHPELGLDRLPGFRPKA